MIGWNNIGLKTWWTTVGLSVYFCLYQGAVTLHAQEQATGGEYRATIGMRLPDIHTLDPRAFPFDKQAHHGISYLGSRQPLLRWQPVSLKREVALESTGRQITIREELFDQPVRLPYVASLADYYEARVAHEYQIIWHDYASRAVYQSFLADGRHQGGLNVDIPVPIKSKAFQQIFGGSTVGLNVQGDIRIEGGFRREDRSEVRTAYNSGANTNFKMNQTQRFTVTGRIGEKVTVNVDQDSERAFDFENNIKLNYTGFDDEVVQKIEAGNIALSLPGTRYVTFGGTSAGLFGIKSEMQLGNLYLTSVASQEKGENKKLTLQGGAEQGSQRIEDSNYRRNTYFFLDHIYRTQYNRFSSKWVHTYDPPNAIARIEVYKSAPGYDTNQDAIPGDAYTDIMFDDSSRVIPGSEDRTEFYSGHFLRLEPNIDYELVRTLGYIRMNTPLQEGEVLAVAYVDSAGRIHGEIGYRPGADRQNRPAIRLKLIKDKNSRPVSPRKEPKRTWHLEWKNVYYLGSRNIPQDGFELKMYFKPPSGDPQENVASEGNRSKSYLNIFGLDVRDLNGSADSPDNLIDNDPNIIDFARGELIFPDVRPFDPDGDDIPLMVGGTEIKSDLTGLGRTVAAMYDTSSNSAISANSKFYLDLRSQNRSTNYSLGFNVIEASEEVLLNGRRLQKDRDYIIDYFSGSLTLLTEDATKPDARVDVSYQSNSLFQLEKKTILGSRAEYRLNRDSFIGGTFLYLNERSLDTRVRLGSVDRGPMRNMVWDLNAKLQFRPNFLSRALDALPLLSTQEQSDLRLEGEIAQILPNPNTLNNEGTSDNNGVAYVDDFEGTKRTTPLGVARRGWVQCSIPLDILNDTNIISFPDDGIPSYLQRRSLARRAELLWNNPFQGVPIKSIWPDRDVNSNVAQTTQVLDLYFTPLSEDSLSNLNGVRPQETWGGITRGLSPGFFDQTDTKFIELWIFGTAGRVHVELGQISEDIIPNDKLDTEDRIPDGFRNGILDDGEDTGIDGMFGADPNDFWDINGNGVQDRGEPSSLDDWFYESGSSRPKSSDGRTVNGMEGNFNDEGGPRPDTEDINNNGGLDKADHYYGYTFDLDPLRRKFVAGTTETGWVLYRIPLTDSSRTQRGQPDLGKVEYVRLWLDGFNRADSTHLIRIAEINLVANEWKEIGISTQDTTLATFMKDDRIEVTIVNTEENQLYVSPPGVEREVDKITLVQSREQSQVIRVTNLMPGEVAMAGKSLFQPINFIRYNRLRMFLHGSPTRLDSVALFEGQLPIQFFIRFGSDERNFYEFRETVFVNPVKWDGRNEMDIDLAELTNFKLSKGDHEDAKPVPGVSDYFTKPVTNPPAGSQQELRVRGNPSLTNVRLFLAGIVLPDSAGAPFDGEIWMDELRVSDVQKDKGIASRARADLKLADVGSFNIEIEKLDADFHNVSQRFGSGDNTQRVTLGGNLTLDKFLPNSLGLSIPVSMSYSANQSNPKWVSGSDILIVPETDALVRSRVDAFSDQRGVNISVSRRAKSKNFIFRNTVDNVRASYSYTRARAENSTTVFSNRIGDTGSLDYNLAFGRNNFIKPFGWIGKAPLLGKLTDTKLYFTPQNFTFRVGANSNWQKSQTRTLRNNATVEDRADTIRTQDYTVTHNFSTQFKILENLTTDFSRAFTNKLRPNLDTLSVDSTGTADLLLKRIGFIQGIQQFIQGNDIDLLNNTQAFNVRYNPNVFTWLPMNFSYGSNYRFNNNIQQGATGRSSSVQRTISGGTTLSFTKLFGPLIEKKKKPAARPQPRGGRQRPGQQPGEGDKGPKEQEPQQPEQGGGFSFNPVTGLFTLLTKLKDVQLQANERTSVTHTALDTTGNVTPSLRYQLGVDLDPGIGQVPGISSNFANVSTNRTLSANSGFDLGRSFSVGLRFAYDENETETTTHTGGSSLSWFSPPGSDGGGFPFPEWTFTFSGLEKLPLFKRVASTVSLNTNVSGQRITVWRESPKNVTSQDFNISFRPLLKINFNWKNGMITSMQVNRTRGFKPTYSPTLVDNPDELTEQEYFDLAFQSASRTTNTDFSFSHTYSKRSGFKIPLPFLKNKELKNSIDLSITYVYNITEGFQQSGRNSEEVKNNLTKRWSFTPRVTYSFSQRVRGGAHFEVGKTESLRSGTTSIKEFSIDVNISIRGG